ncbi:MAG: iron-sulfur cluster assembly accessory protein [Gammaproteobacteria bacterium]|nr:MAG: iron-sulfur cluster assembly accessory protein [Gammaproteobacteria bacterium]
MINITPQAQKKMAELIEQADDDIEAIRVYVTGGGCSGMTYGMTYTDTRSDRDAVYEGENFKVYVDPVALGYMNGSEIDFVTRGANASFVFNNVFKSVGGSGGCAGCGGGACG